MSSYAWAIGTSCGLMDTSEEGMGLKKNHMEVINKRGPDAEIGQGQDKEDNCEKGLAGMLVGAFRAH